MVIGYNVSDRLENTEPCRKSVEKCFGLVIIVDSRNKCPFTTIA